MSAYVVDDTVINDIINAAVCLKVHTPRRAAVPPIQFNHHNATALGRVLLAENIRSVEYRYPNIPQSERDGYAAQLAAYTFKPRVGLRDYISCGGQLATYDYQACETNDYDMTEAAGIIRAIGFEILRHLTRTP